MKNNKVFPSTIDYVVPMKRGRSAIVVEACTIYTAKPDVKIVHVDPTTGKKITLQSGLKTEELKYLAKKLTAIAKNIEEIIPNAK